MEEVALEIFFDLIIVGQQVSKQILRYLELRKYIYRPMFPFSLQSDGLM